MTCGIHETVSRTDICNKIYTFFYIISVVYLLQANVKCSKQNDRETLVIL